MMNRQQQQQPQLYPNIYQQQQQQQPQQQQPQVQQPQQAAGETGQYNYIQSPHNQSIYRLNSIQSPTNVNNIYSTPSLSNSLYPQQQIPQQQQQFYQQQQAQQPTQTPLQQSIIQQTPIQQPYAQSGYIQSPYIDNQNINLLGGIDQQSTIQQQYPQQPQNKPTSETLLSLTPFNKDEDLKSIFINSTESVDGSIDKVSNIPDPTSKLLYRRDPGYNYVESNSLYWSTLVIDKHLELPQEITNSYLNTSTKSLLGLFPEIGRAWISIDQILYLWDYRDTNEYISHNLSQIITNCALLTPKKNTFKDSVKKVMVVCTHVEIFVFALCFSTETKFELISGLSTPTDNIFITDIVGTKEGRIFLSGQDGNIYEIEYSKDNLFWFSNEKIKKVNHTQTFMNSFINLSKKKEIIQLVYDEHRFLLYSLSKDSTVHIYSLGVKGDEFKFIKSINPLTEFISLNNQQQSSQYQPQQQYQQQAQQFNNNLQNMVLMSIHVSPIETPFNFIAILSGGERLYYTNTDKLGYIRSPPNSDGSGGNGNIHYTYYSNGVFFTASEVNDLEDRLVGTTYFGNDNIKQHYETLSKSISGGYSNQISQDTLSEKSNLFSIRGRISVIKEDIVNPTNLGLSTVYYKELSNEHMSTPRRFLCLNSLGLQFITKLRYQDILSNILSSNNSQDIDHFFESFGKIITSSLCIGLYCSSPHSSILLNDQIYSSTSIPKTTTTRIADLAMTWLKRKSGKPTFHLIAPAFNGDMGAAVNKTEIYYSNAYNGLLAYLGRVLYPIWNQSLIKSNGDCNWSIVELRLFQSHLCNLLSFLDISQLIPKGKEIPIIKLQPTIQNNVNATAATFTEDDAIKNEKRNLIGISNIIVNSIQILNLLLLLSSYNFKQLFDNSSISNDLKRKIDLIKFKDVLNFELINKSLVNQLNNNDNGTGASSNTSAAATTASTTETINSITSLLIDSLMKSLNSHNISIDQVSNQLETECSLFFKKDNRELYKVREKLNMVKRDGSSYLTDSLIKDSIVILESIAPNFNLPEIVELLISINSLSYITPLCLHYSKELDPHGITLVPSPNPSDEYIDKLNQKKEAYNQIIDLLNKVQNESINNNGGNGGMVDQQFESNIIMIIDQVLLNSPDRLIHEMIYSWLLKNGMTYRLFEIQSDFITDFLFSNDIDLCWKVLAKHQEFIKACQVLLQIADRATTLDDKIIAYTNCTMILSDQKDHEIYILAKSNITFANIQKQITIQLENYLNNRNLNGGNGNGGNNGETTFSNSEIRESISNLNKTIFDITTLFTDYARKYYLHEQMLQLCHIGNHSDQNFIQILWKIIIDKEIPQEVNTHSDDDNAETVPPSSSLSMVVSVGGVIESLISKISNIGYDFYPNDITFPVEFIINYAERAIFNFSKNKSEQEKREISPNWLTSSLHDHVKVDYWILVEYYNNIIEKSPNWKQDDQASIYITTVYFYLVESLINSIQTSTERRLFSSKQIHSQLENRIQTFKSITQRQSANYQDQTKRKLSELENKFEKIISISKSFKDFRY